MKESNSGYRYDDGNLNASHDYLLPTVKEVLATLSSCRRIFEVGCGNGSVANVMSKLGFEVTGVDASEEGIAHAHHYYPAINLRLGSAYDDLSGQYGQFPIVVSLEVIEHMYFPRKFGKTLYELVEPGGVAIVSIPFHGYWKNVVLSLTGKMDDHFTALWDYGHIKFWSIRTLNCLLKEVGFQDIRFIRVGRIRILAKSLIAIARKPIP